MESFQGEGSVFYFTLPCNAETKVKPAAENVVPGVAKGSSVKNLKILIVENDEISEILIQIAVKKYSKEIIKVKTGVEAVEICRNNPDIDLVLMDIRLPEMDGYKATQKIREFNKEVIIIAQTAYGLEGDREKAIESGCNDHIAKPISKAELLELIQKHFFVN